MTRARKKSERQGEADGRSIWYKTDDLLRGKKRNRRREERERENYRTKGVK